MIELLLIVGLPVALYFAYRIWRESLARMFLSGYVLGVKHERQGFVVVEPREGDR